MSTIDRFRLVGLALLAFADPLAPARAGAQPAPAAERHAQEGFRLAQEGRDFRSAEAELREAVRLEPSNSAYLSALGGVLAVQGRFAEAGELFEKALVLRPSDLAIRRNLAAAQWQQGRLRLASANLERILRVQPGDEPSILLQGIVRAELHDCERALPLIESVAVLARARPEAGIALATCYYASGKLPQGREALMRLLSPPAPAGNRLRGARIAARADDFETALRLFSSIRSEGEDRPALQYNIAYCQYRLGHFRDARETLGLLAEGRQGGSAVLSLIGWSHHAEGRLEQAIPAFRSAIEASPREDSNYLDLAMALMDSKRHPAALSVVEAALKTVPDSFALVLMRGILETALGHYIDAIESFGRARKLNPDSPEANLNLALVQSAAGEKNASRETLDAGMERFPGHAPHYLEHGRLLLALCRTGDDCSRDRAGSMFRKAMELDRESSEARYEAGMLALEDGLYPEAAGLLESASRLDPGKSKFALALARAYVRLGRSEEAAAERTRFETLRGEEDLANPRYYGQRRAEPRGLFDRAASP
ncbi:MAG: tetratricopeptide repeat protein [Bryobacterales bacterium]|nr:tetratricopeptide repeat protein [Bryobacterales bacterium]